MDRGVQNSTLQYQEVHKVHKGETERNTQLPSGTEVPEIPEVQSGISGTHRYLYIYSGRGKKKKLLA